MTDETVLPRTAGAYCSAISLVLVGFMGAGKTTVGEALAARIGCGFADLDRLIESRQGRTVPQIFEQEGEPRFRELEREVLEETLAAHSRPLVLALGGGAFAGEGIRELLREHAVPAVWLDAPAEELFRRCEQPDVVRPLRRSLREFVELYEQRLSSYRQADVHVVTNAKAIPEIIDEIIEALPAISGSRSAE